MMDNVQKVNSCPYTTVTKRLDLNYSYWPTSYFSLNLVFINPPLHYPLRSNLCEQTNTFEIIKFSTSIKQRRKQ
jgi:hypothetical protein